MNKTYENKHEIEARMNALHQALCNTDYKAIKATEGHPSKDWDDITVKRQLWRDEINELERKLDEMPDGENE